MKEIKYETNWKARLIRPTFNSRRLYRLYLQYKNLNSLFYFNQDTFRIKDIVVCGMERSGSTLLFNIINEVLRENRSVLDPYFDDEIQYKKILAHERSILVKKNHMYVPLVAKRIRKGQTIGFFTHRDLRDVIVSLLQAGWLDKAETWVKNYRVKSISNNAMLYASTPNMHIFGYQQLICDKEEVIKEVANILNVSLTPEVIRQIDERTSIDKMRQKHYKQPTPTPYGFDHQMHTGHIADGEIGKWKRCLTPQEVHLVTQQCRKYLAFFGYE